MEYILLYIEFIKIKLKGMFEYRNAFLWTSLAKATGWAADFMIIWVMLNQFQDLGGWSTYEVMLLYSLNVTSYSLAGFFLFHPCTKLSQRIRNGEFDEILTKPLNSFLYLVCREFSTGYFSNLAVSITVLCICISKLNIPLTPINIALLILVSIGGALIQGAAFIFTSVPAFWIVQNSALMNIVNNLKSFVRYPVSLYNKGIQILLTLVIPYAFINFYPAQIFLKKNDFMMFHPVFQYLTPIVGLLLFAGGYLFWQLGISHYKSTGS